MSKNITALLKLVLVGFSIYLCIFQFNLDNSTMGIYWIVVAFYWFFNFLSGLPFKK